MEFHIWKKATYLIQFIVDEFYPIHILSVEISQQIQTACQIAVGKSCPRLWNGLGRWVNSTWKPFCKGNDLGSSIGDNLLGTAIRQHRYFSFILSNITLINIFHSFVNQFILTKWLLFTNLSFLQILRTETNPENGKAFYGYTGTQQLLVFIGPFMESHCAIQSSKGVFIVTVGSIKLTITI